MNSESKPPAEPKLSPAVPRRLLWACAGFLLLIVIAVTLPDLPNYLLLKKQLDFQQRQSMISSNMPLPITGTNLPATPVSSNKEPTAIAGTRPSTEVTVSADRLFESYGRFLTLIVG